jgi:hypothetical protein
MCVNMLTHPQEPCLLTTSLQEDYAGVHSFWYPGYELKYLRELKLDTEIERGELILLVAAFIRFRGPICRH